MPANIAEYWPLIIAGVLLVALVIWFVLRANRKARVIGEKKGDVLDEGAERAQRNQVLIDAPTAVARDVGQTSANANSDMIAAAGAVADAEAGASVPPTTSGDSQDDLTQIKGLGPKIATLLESQGITRFSQIAAWSESDIERIDASLGKFAGRITRDQWVEQAKLLVSGDNSGFSAKFGQNR